MRSKYYTSFSVFGLCITLIVDGTLTVLSYTLELLVIAIQSCRNTHTYQHLEWTVNETLQLQRLAHKELGCGSWQKTNGVVPVTRADEMLAIVDVLEPEHPKPVASSRAKERSAEGGNSKK